MPSQSQELSPLMLVNMALDDKKEDAGEEVLTTEEALAKVAMILAKTENPKLLTELSIEEIVSISVLASIAEKTENHMLKDFLNNFMYLKVSHQRKGRKELLDIAKSIREEPEKGFGRIRKLFGGGAG